MDADLDFTTDNSQYRNSTSSYGTDLLDNHHTSSRLQHHQQYRDSLHSFSSNSDQQQQQLPPQANWISKPSFESINTNSSISNISQQLQSHLSNQSYNNYSTEGKEQLSLLLFLDINIAL